MLLPLEFLRTGECGDIAEITGEPGWIHRMAELGVCVGCRLQILQAGCPCLLQVGSCRLSLRGEGQCSILVRPVLADS
jgi:Fe2+ transport system protein FeoA